MKAMHYRRFGRTQLKMPVFSCGGMRFQEDWKDKPLEEVNAEVQANLEATVDHAFEIGVNHFETARGYGMSEKQLGQVLPKLPRDEILVQTKIAPHKDPQQFSDELIDSLDRLNLDRVDLFTLHGINTKEHLQWALSPGGCFDAAQDLRRRNKCRFVGFSTHGQLDVILRAVEHGQPVTGEGFDYINLHWYFIFQRNWPVIERAAARDMGVFIISPSDKGGRLYSPSEKLVRLCTPLHPMAFNDLFCLARPQVHTLSLGAARPGDFDIHRDALQWLDRAQATLAPIEKRLRDAMRESAGFDSPEATNEGIPDWQHLPHQLNVSVMLWLRNLVRGWGMEEYGRMRFNLLGGGGHWFPGAKPADVLPHIDADELRRTVAASPYADRIPAMLEDALELMVGEPVRRESEGGP